MRPWGWIRCAVPNGSSRLTVPILVASMAVQSAGLAQVTPAGDAVELTYSAPSACPDAADFVRRVRARVPRLRAPDAGETPRIFRVEVSEVGDRTIGVITIQEPGAPASTRSIDAASCGELVDALALVVALAIDPRASMGPVTPPAGSSESEPAPTPSPSPTPAPILRTRWGLGAQALIVSGVAPAAMVAGAATLTVARAPARWRSPSATLLFTHGPTRTFPADDGVASFAFTAVMLDVCPLTWPWGAHLAARACATGESGVIRAAGADTLAPRRVWAPWWAAGFALPVDWQPRDFLTVSVRSGATSPATEARFLLGSAIVHDLPSIAWRTGIGLGLVLP